VYCELITAITKNISLDYTFDNSPSKNNIYSAVSDDIVRVYICAVHSVDAALIQANNERKIRSKVL
jgi:uncharacterized pyridoxamine 5'-phosphate oxidase family protein